MDVYMHGCFYVYIYVYVYTCMDVIMHVSMNGCIYVCMNFTEI